MFKVLHILGRKYINTSKEDLEKIDLTIPQSRILILLRDNKKDMIQREISDLASIEPTSMSRMLDTLEKKGLIERHANRRSRRSFAIGLTEKGYKKAGEAADIYHASQDEIFSKLTTEEVNQLYSLLNKAIGRGE